MPLGWTTTDLLTRIRLHGRLSSNDADFTDANLLDLATSVMLSRIVPEIIRVRQEYYDRYEDTSIVADQRAYAFSSRAYASVLREVVYIDSASNESPLVPLTYQDSHAYAGSTGSRPEAYVVEDDKVILLPTPSVAQGTLRLVYEYQPAVLVPTSECMLITAVNTTTGVCTGSEPGWSTSNQLDVIKGSSPFALINADLTPSAVSAGTSVTFTASELDSTRIAVNDYLSEAGESCIPQIPSVLHDTLAQATAATALNIRGDTRAASALEPHVSADMARIRGLLTPRVKGRQKKWMNAGSPLRRTRGFGRVWDDGSV